MLNGWCLNRLFFLLRDGCRLFRSAAFFTVFSVFFASLFVLYAVSPHVIAYHRERHISQCVHFGQLSIRLIRQDCSHKHTALAVCQLVGVVNVLRVQYERFRHLILRSVYLRRLYCSDSDISFVTHILYHECRTLTSENEKMFVRC